MKKLKQLSVIILLFHLFSCNHSSSASANQAQAATASTTAGTSGDASFSCKIDGKDFSSSEKSEMQNVAVNLIGRSKGKVLFSLSDLKQNASGVDMLSFIVPAQQGSITLTASTSTPGLDDYILQGINYIPNPVTVNIISINATKITGTFSGKYSMPSGAGYSKTVEVTDGKFDIPFSTSQDFIKMIQNTSK